MTASKASATRAMPAARLSPRRCTASWRASSSGRTPIASQGYARTWRRCCRPARRVLRAISALDIAPWDRNARAAVLPLYKYLGAAVTDRVPAYASYYLEGKAPEMLGEEVAGMSARVSARSRSRSGASAISGASARGSRRRAAIGADVLLMLDANNERSNLSMALPYSIEEPFGPDAIDNHARLARLTPVPVATSEIEGGRGASSSCSTKARRSSCRLMPASAAGSASSGASPRSRRAMA